MTMKEIKTRGCSVRKGGMQMRRVATYMLLMILAISLIGCGAGPKISIVSQGNKTDVFSEIKEETPIPKGFSDLVIKAHIKTHLEGYSLFEPKESPHGKPEYPFLLNIDGQVVIWNAKGVKEITPEHDWWGRITPEGGEGMKYELNRKIRLRAGPHAVSFVLPAEEYMETVEIKAEEGKTHVLEFKPIYNIDVTTYKTRSGVPLRNFMYELREYEGFLDGNRIS
jgi:hypothetical protein